MLGEETMYAMHYYIAVLLEAGDEAAMSFLPGLAGAIQDSTDERNRQGNSSVHGTSVLLKAEAVLGILAKPHASNVFLMEADIRIE